MPHWACSRPVENADDPPTFFRPDVQAVSGDTLMPERYGLPSRTLAGPAGLEPDIARFALASPDPEGNGRTGLPGQARWRSGRQGHALRRGLARHLGDRRFAHQMHRRTAARIPGAGIRADHRYGRKAWIPDRAAGLVGPGAAGTAGPSHKSLVREPQRLICRSERRGG
jgi:hypothetical protein